MARENLRDSPPGAGKRRDQTPPPQHYRASHCELRGCPCGGRGKADIAIQDANKNVLGYVCQRGYQWHIDAHGLDQHSCVKVEGIKAREPEQGTLDQQRTYQHVTEALQQLDDFDRYADSMAHAQDNDDAND